MSVMTHVHVIGRLALPGVTLSDCESQHHFHAFLPYNSVLLAAGRPSLHPMYVIIIHWVEANSRRRG